MTNAESGGYDQQAFEHALHSIWVDLVALQQQEQGLRQRVEAYLTSKNIKILDFITVIVSENSEADMDLACKCVNMICSAVGVKNLEEVQLLKEGLTHPSARITLLVLNIFSQDSTVVDTPMLPLIYNCLACEDERVARAATKLILEVAVHTSGETSITVSTSNQLVTLYHQASSETISLRIYELVVQLLCKFYEDLGIEEPTDAMQVLESILLEPLQSSDILERLNTIEILSALFSSKPGYECLVRTDCLQWIASGLQSQDDSVDAILLESVAVKFYAKLALKQPFLLTAAEVKFGFASAIQTILLDDSSMIRADVKEACLLAVGNIGSTKTGLAFLSGGGPSDFTAAVHALVDTVRLGMGSSRTIALQALSCILDNDDSTKSFVIENCQSLLVQIGGMVQLLSFLKSFDEGLRIAAYACLKGAFKYDWGFEFAKDCGQLLAFLLDRGTEATQLGMKWRFACVQAVAMHPNSSSILPPPIFQRFVKYAKEGPVFIESQPMVMLESA